MVDSAKEKHQWKFYARLQKIVSEYDQEIPQSQTRGIVWKSHITITRH